jgi:hypothetical protein
MHTDLANDRSDVVASPYGCPLNVPASIGVSDSDGAPVKGHRHVCANHNQYRRAGL